MARALIALATSLALATFAHAGSYDAPPQAASLQLGASKPTCATILTGRSYDCTVVSSFNATPFTDCYDFLAPSMSSQFDLHPVGLGATLGCSCNPTGSVKKPKFNQSKQFTCVGDAQGTVFTFEGKVAASGKKITGGRDASAVGNTFLYSCTVRASGCE